jgi:tRNA threonylcarbamoyladenosine biosynthesis protein TsaB
VAAGTGWAAYADVFKDKAGDRFVTSLNDCFPTAEAIAKLAVKDHIKGIAVPAAEAVPIYLRDKVAKKPGAKA